MNTAAETSPSEQLLALTQEMLAFAEAGEWEQLADLEQSRLPLLNQIFSQGISGNVELAREILSMDAKTKKMAETQMPILQQEIKKIKNSGKANNAYQTIQNSTSGND